ncbi:MAG: hypothetical protein ABI056_04295, partial [Caulobacteraceae bacterium]
SGQATQGGGVFLGAGGSVVNGSAGDHAALIQEGVVIGAAGALTNAGTILAADFVYGAEMFSGTLTNGSLNNSGALIQGNGGVYLLDRTQGSNFGTISGTGDAGSGVRLDSGASITNGAAGHTSALIEGDVGASVYFNPYYEVVATVTNFGTIIGTGGTAVELATSADVLNVGAGSGFVGAVLGAGGTLDLLSGTGTITGLFAAGGDVTVSGSMAKTTFQNFATVVVSAGATFTDKGAMRTAAGETVNDAGTLNLNASGKNINAGLIETTGAGALTIAGPLVNTGTLAADGGTLFVNGAVTGAGVAVIDGGTLALASSFNEAVAFTGTTGVLDLTQSKAYTATITGFSKSGQTGLDLGDIGFVKSTEATFSGNTKSGVLTVTDGTNTAHIILKGNYTTSTFVSASDGHGGTIVTDSKAKDAAVAPSSLVPPHPFIAAMAGLGASAVAGAIHIAAIGPSRESIFANPHVMTA